MATDFSTKCAILSELWMNHRDEEDLTDFVEYNDLGLPMAYLINTELVTANKSAEVYIDETFSLLAAAIGVDPEGDYQSLNHMFSQSEQ